MFWGRSAITNRFWNVLFDSILKFLGSAAHMAMDLATNATARYALMQVEAVGSVNLLHLTSAKMSVIKI